MHKVIYPPPLGRPAVSAGGSRRNGFISVARIDRSKQWPRLVTIIEKVRALGHEVTLTLAGSRYDPRLLLEIEELARKHQNWLRLAVDQPREALDQLMSEHKYGIHGMIDEHYGMAVAELVLAGCLTFVHDSGGQVEIVSQPEARYTDVDDAVAKIATILSSPSKQAALAKAQALNRENITRERFLAQFHAFLDELESGKELVPLQLEPPISSSGLGQTVLR